MNAGFFNITKILKNFLSHHGRRIAIKIFSPRYILATNVGISIVSTGFGDVFEQHYEIITKKINKFDPLRTMNMSISGCPVGILCHYWYNKLDSKFPGRNIKTVVKKVFLDQVIFSPILLSAFFLTFAILENLTIEEFQTEFRTKAWRLYVTEWFIWPPAQLFNFYILPTKYRILYNNTISLGYDVYISYVKHDKS